MSGPDFTEVPCRFCETPTTMTATRMCDRCWELEHRLRSEPTEIVRKIKDYIRETP